MLPFNVVMVLSKELIRVMGLGITCIHSMKKTDREEQRVSLLLACLRLMISKKSIDSLMFYRTWFAHA